MVALLTLSLVAYFVLRNDGVRKAALLVASYILYYEVNSQFVLLLIALTSLDYTCALAMRAHERRKLIYLMSSVVGNLCALGYFKYSNFFVESIEDALGTIGVDAEMPVLRIVLPLGLSFIVFHGISFTVDTYRDRIAKVPSLLEYALYVAFFPKLLAGPITRANTFLGQLTNLPRANISTVSCGAELILLGVFKKVVVASYFSAQWVALSAAPQSLGTLGVIVAGAVYGLFILFDFSGYTDIARGSARVLGIELPINFQTPYGATSVSNFWRRWHITLSSWIRDYIYIPLGGNRRGLGRTCVNLMIAMLLCGLWHGAAWTYVVWGGLHGSVMCIEQLAGRLKGSALDESFLKATFIFFLVSLFWIFFASSDVTRAGLLFEQISTMDTSARVPVMLLLAALVLFLGPIASYFRLYDRLYSLWQRHVLVAISLNTAMLVAVIIQYWQGADPGEFVYFRF